jgi:hypothetical protein
MGYMSTPFSRTKEEDSDDSNISIHREQNNKGKDVKGRWVLCFLLFFCLGFVLLLVLSFLTHSSSLEKNLSPKIQSLYTNEAQ